MSMKKKIVAAGLVACVAATAIGGATLAYFTDQHDVQNTFTVGNVGIALNETTVADPDNKVVAGTRQETGDGEFIGFTYDEVVPGMKYSKNVDVTVDAGSMNAYVFVELNISDYAALQELIATAATEDGLTIDESALDTAFLYSDSGAPLAGGTLYACKMQDDGSYSLVYSYGVKEAGAHIDVFDGVQIPSELNKAMSKVPAGGFDLKITAYAIQETGLNLAEAANEFFAGYTLIGA